MKVTVKKRKLSLWYRSVPVRSRWKFAAKIITLLSSVQMQEGASLQSSIYRKIVEGVDWNGLKQGQFQISKEETDIAWPIWVPLAYSRSFPPTFDMEKVGGDDGRYVQHRISKIRLRTMVDRLLKVKELVERLKIHCEDEQMGAKILENFSKV